MWGLWVGYDAWRNHAVETSRELVGESGPHPVPAPSPQDASGGGVNGEGESGWQTSPQQPQRAGTGWRRRFRAYRGKPVWALSQWGCILTAKQRGLRVPQAPWDLEMLTPVLRAPHRLQFWKDTLYWKNSQPGKLMDRPFNPELLAFRVQLHPAFPTSKDCIKWPKCG